MSLKQYLSKRNVKETKEPKAKIVKRKKRASLQFVVQKHAASHLHYDFRLEVKGVLKSWAIPKGPSLNPQQKRLAVMVEDHPFNYKNFEGIIPRGYGTGIVIIWDEGTYCVDELDDEESEKTIVKGLKKGGIHFTLKGKKLKGAFSLIKLKNSEHNWLLIKKNDKFASTQEITKKERSVKSKKRIEDLEKSA